MPNEFTGFSILVRGLREKAKLSVEEAASRLGVPTNVLEEWEMGVSLPLEISAQKISRIYGISKDIWLEVVGKYCDSLSDWLR